MEAPASRVNALRRACPRRLGRVAPLRGALRRLGRVAPLRGELRRLGRIAPLQGALRRLGRVAGCGAKAHCSRPRVR
ncbi:hypothetical protein L5D93_02485 [Paenibacillus thiaminolyticus]|nr:hypothetical protein [Paenibacillus thiaminolyticus]